MMTGQIELFRDSKKTRNLFLKSAGLCIILALAAVYSLGVFDGIIKIKLAVVSCAILVIMLFFLISSLLKLKDKAALVVINSRGISGSTTPVSKAFGEIVWPDVQDIQLEKVSGDTLVAFTVENDRKYADRLSKSYRGMAYKKEIDKYVIMYTASEIETDAPKLFDLVNQYWVANKSK